MSARHLLKVFTIGFAMCALIACGFLANESPRTLEPESAPIEVTAPIAR